MTMAIVAGKLMYLKAFELQSRVFLKPWRETKIIIRCCSNTDFPVRYVPKRSSNLNKPNEPDSISKKPEAFELHRYGSVDLVNDKFSNDRERSGIGSYLGEKSPDFKSGNLRSKGKKVHNSSVRLDVLEHSYKWRSAESNSMEELHESNAMEGLEGVPDALDSHNGEYEVQHLATEPSESKENDDLMNANCNLKSKGKIVCNSSVRSDVLEHTYKWRSAESNSVEEVHELDAMEGHEDSLDELDSHNGEYEAEHLSTEPSENKEKAENTAIRLLAARAYTMVELKKKLSGKKFSPEVVNAVISDFQNRGLINDLLYAEAFSRSRWSLSSWGPRRIKQALAKKDNKIGFGRR
ncbi:uncharacterized protein LOC143591094 [Bidens hawaiensis]|uniref:uncharacterized protein LOC143591094 n=1 Tax=Bidens hawaiensis TaxID=980011 RepID=UPI004049A38B